MFFRILKFTCVNATLFNLFLGFSLTLKAEDKVCEKRETNVIDALHTLTNTYNSSESGWYFDPGEDSTRSGYEVYTRYAALAFVLDMPVEMAASYLHDAGEIGPKIAKSKYWNWEDYSRMGEASMQTGRPISEAMKFLDDTYRASQKGWRNIDYSRAASAGFIAGASPEHVAHALKMAHSASDYSYWEYGAFSRAAEAALAARRDPEEAAKKMDDVYREVIKISSGWNDDDYARIARAALVMNMPSAEAARILKETKNVIKSISGSWNDRDYSRMAGAAIISGKSPEEAAIALRDTWNSRGGIASGWEYADYSTMAAAALLGRGLLADRNCRRLFKAW